MQGTLHAAKMATRSYYYATKCTLSAIKWHYSTAKKQVSVSPDDNRLFRNTVGNEFYSRTNGIYSITVASDLVSLHYATIGAFVTSGIKRFLFGRADLALKL